MYPITNPIIARISIWAMELSLLLLPTPISSPDLLQRVGENFRTDLGDAQRKQERGGSVAQSKVLALREPLRWVPPNISVLLVTVINIWS